MRRPSSRLAAELKRATMFQSHASRIVRLSRSDSSHIERHSTSRQPSGSKKRVPSAGANWKGAPPCANGLLQVLSMNLSSRGEERSMSQKRNGRCSARSEEHTSELQSRLHLVCRLLLEKKKKR